MIEIEYVFSGGHNLPPGQGTVRRRAVVPEVPKPKTMVAPPGEAPRWLVTEVVYEHRDGYDEPPTIYVLCSKLGGFADWHLKREEREGPGGGA